MNNYYFVIDSPIGQLHLTSNKNKLTGVFYSLEKRKSSHVNNYDFINDKSLIIEKTIFQLFEYFEGKRKNFNIPLEYQGTNFQIKAWKALKKIPYAKTVSYSDQATIAGNPKATRAIGNANNANPISIIIPCHRVIGKSGKLVGYGGGLDKKDYLLNLEIKYD